MELEINSAALQAAIAAGPAVLTKHMDRAIGRVVQTMGRAGRRNAPKAFSQLTNSIQVRRPDALSGEVIVGAEHGFYVEHGTGQFGPGSAIGLHRMPPVASILDWVKLRQIQPDDPDMSQEDLAFVIAKAIATTGTPAQPFLQPAFDDNKAAAEARLNAAIDAALEEIGA